MSASPVRLSEFIADFVGSPLASWVAFAPWELTAQSENIVRELLAALPAREYELNNEVAIHITATVEAGAVLKGPLVLGPQCFVAAGAYLRGGNWVAERCTFGPGAELKSSFVFAGTKLAHFNFVGDSILGADVNLEAGSVICNYRNERADKEVLVRVGSGLYRTSSQKFGAVVGDHCRIGANAVIAPGALLWPRTVVRRMALIDHEASPTEPGQLPSSSTPPGRAHARRALCRGRWARTDERGGTETPTPAESAYAHHWTVPLWSGLVYG